MSFMRLRGFHEEHEIWGDLKNAGGGGGDNQAALPSHTERSGPARPHRDARKADTEALSARHQAETPHWQGVPLALLAFFGLFLSITSLYYKYMCTVENWRKNENKTKLK